MNSSLFVRMNRSLRDGDIIRCIVTNPRHKNAGMHYYAIATGTGFGSELHTMGNAIFVKCDGPALNIILEKKAGRIPTLSKEANRWERSWGIDILEVRE